VLTFFAGVLAISFAAIFVRLALPAPPVVTGFYRMLFASVLLGAWLCARRRAFAFERRAVLLALASGVCFGTDIALWHTSLVLTTVGIATLLVNTTPVHVGLYSLLVLRQRLKPGFVAGAGLALSGTLVLLGMPEAGAGHLRGALLALTAAVFYAGYLLLMSAARRGVPAVPALLLMTASATVTLGVCGLVGGDAFGGFPASSWTAMLAAAVISQIGGVMGIVWALRYLPATLASVGLLAQPVGTALLGWILLGEPITALQALGGVAVLCGILLASQASRPELREPTAELRRPA
jgi:drug/metabolite transporter (DMT)-like permease